jgi:Na+/H+ antiporter NhaD/arsenite permease-like protein
MVIDFSEIIKMDVHATYLNLLWCIPFAGLLLSIALAPLLAENFWHKHYGKITFFWSVGIILPLYYSFPSSAATHALLETMLHHYIPFVCILAALFTISGGIHLTIKGQATPHTNTIFLAIGMLLASAIGTTGASILLIRPFIALNKFRRFKTHLVIFFIFLVSNIGGSLTPLGDPPLFLGFLNGIDFFWPTTALFQPFLTVSSIVLLLFWIVDRYYFMHDPRIEDPEHTPDTSRFTVYGKRNFIFLGITVLTILLSGIYQNNASLSIAGVFLLVSDLLRDIILIIIAVISFVITPKKVHHYNHFTWEPFKEVSKLFAGIFITILPVIAMLKAGKSGALAPLVDLVNPGGFPDNLRYFWFTGALSSFLDNAPTYLVFFHMAGGDPAQLMTTLSTTLTAISAGSVFMGAITYIGNAPNFMVKSIATHAHVQMPSFFGYMIWSFIFLVPSFLLLSWIYFS